MFLVVLLQRILKERVYKILLIVFKNYKNYQNGIKTEDFIGSEATPA